jgi:hypothetical protein
MATTIKSAVVNAAGQVVVTLSNGVQILSEVTLQLTSDGLLHWYGAGVGVPLVSTTQITGVTLSNVFFPSGQLPLFVGNIVVATNSAPFTGILSLSGATQFQVAGTAVETTGPVVAGVYHFNVVPVQAGFGNSGAPFPVTVVAGKALSDVNGIPVRTNNGGYVPAE